MFGIGTGELLLLLVLALLVLGPERMPKLARDIGKTVGDLRRTSDELRSEFLNADRSLNIEKALDVAARTTEQQPTATAAPETGKAAEIGATMGDSGLEQAGATQADVVGPPTETPAIPAEPDETAFDRELRLARERIDKGASSQ
jgi:sec-independent protein translocase protein TatB